MSKFNIHDFRTVGLAGGRGVRWDFHSANPYRSSVQSYSRLCRSANLRDALAGERGGGLECNWRAAPKSYWSGLQRAIGVGSKELLEWAPKS